MVRLKRVSKMCALMLMIFATELSTAHAQQASDPTDEIVKLYCADGGKLARCIGSQSEECGAIVRPLIEQCQRDVRDVGERQRPQAFANCFSLAYSGKYSSKVRYTKECVTPIEDPGAVKPAPPEFAGKGIYHPPTTR